MATAWGEIEMSVGTTGALDVMATTLTSLGTIKEESLNISTEDGDSMQLFGTGHVLVDQLDGEPTLKVNASLIGVEKAKQFWAMDATNVGQLESFISSKDWSVKFASKVVGSETFEAPKCRIKATPKFSEKEGWTVDLVITVLKGAAGYFFNFGTVAA